MKSIGFIPLRQGSKGIPGKNKRKMVGRPLFTWVLGEALHSDLDIVYVYTDDAWIINFIEKEYYYTDKVKVLQRSASSATDTASTESAMLEFAETINYDFDVFCLLQATSPFTTATDINTSLSKLRDGHDSTVSVVSTHRFTWNSDGTPQNYDYNHRPRRQDFEGLLVENGAVYTCTKAVLQHKQNRLGDKVGIVHMPEESLQEIDSENDWLVVEQLLIARQQGLKKAEKITHLVLDVDGVFTDGTITYTKDGEHTKQFDMRDGMGLEILRQFGVTVMIMTSERSELVAKRMQKLQIEQVFLGVKDKYTLLTYLAKAQGFNLNNVAYVGDDVNDLANICSVGWSLAPSNAMKEVTNQADIILPKPSGDGAIRSACQFIKQYNKRF
ncbi:N-acylneuraminate cytidylyltransferase [Mesoflavibacter sabulilitoris]|uniref:N-acylneuraminate cytidylyltransferase n=1 Tax=Mesoflavibacter zeaxanthinifaciens subsp. sabulilitoris TaxID=1520893 RepID=A0A2T1NB10_9FLAO|nr:acylneuraminate cytidylyltransferase [Mesoflavibacter zeaxanthinifaciens]MBB3123533.1 N-acylneuraminate cytidylyltransferase [Mesoflavibacter zeaxanthinifaciens subsp. sabulilitoris]PSG89336.1 cytidyltransferase [Mesoflavibacter zeaxanthinifaciens subsp. sabulilitoris]